MKRLINETDLEKAETVIAAEAAFEKLANIVEDYGDWILKTYLPLVDEIRRTIGNKTADKLTAQTKEKISTSFENLNRTKETFLNATKMLEKIIHGEKVQFDEKPKFSSDIDILKMNSDADSLKEGHSECSTNQFDNRNVKDKHEKEKIENIHEIKPVHEKWNVKGPVINPKNIGKWKDYTIKELCALWKKLRKKENKTPEDREKIAQIVFAIRAKQYGKQNRWGAAKTACDVKESAHLAEKWNKEVEIDPNERGKWSKYTVKQLCKKYKILRNKKDKTPEDKETLRELAFAIRAKMKWPKGQGPISICNVEVKK